MSDALGFIVGNAAQRLKEAADSLKIFDKATPFKTVIANGPSFEKMAASALLNGDELVPGTNDLTNRINAAAELATESTPTASQINSVTVNGRKGVAHKVSLREVGRDTIVYFEVLPEIVEQHTTEYEAVSPAQSPGSFQKFKGAATTQWTLNVTFISRTSAEATLNYEYLQILRGWTKPFFGNRTGASYPNKLGAPPPVLTFSGLRELIGPVPVVITSLNWNWPKDVDYIATNIRSEIDGNFIPFPTVLQVPIQLIESYSTEQLNNFSLADYRAGRMDVAFNQIEEQEVKYEEGAEPS